MTLRIANVSLLATIAVMSMASQGYACSLNRYHRNRLKGEVYFVGTVRPDTVRATAGTVKYVSARHSNDDTSRRTTTFPVFGKIVSVDRLGAVSTPKLQRAINAAGGKVVVVPWSVLHDCKTTLWNVRESWMPPGTTSMFTAWLRDRAHWIDGRPTFDIFRGAIVSFNGAPAGQSDSLTAYELLDLMANTPLADRTGKYVNAPHEWKPLRRWGEQHPVLAKRYPASLLLDIATDLDTGSVTTVR